MIEYASKKHPGDHLFGLREGDPVVYHRMGVDIEGTFLTLDHFSGKWFVAMHDSEGGLWLPPPSQVSISSKMTRPL